MSKDATFAAITDREKEKIKTTKRKFTQIPKFRNYRILTEFHDSGIKRMKNCSYTFSLGLRHVKVQHFIMLNLVPYSPIGRSSLISELQMFQFTGWYPKLASFGLQCAHIHGGPWDGPKNLRRRCCVLYFDWSRKNRPIKIENKTSPSKTFWAISGTPV